jgi:hypothetical protein
MSFPSSRRCFTSSCTSCAAPSSCSASPLLPLLGDSDGDRLQGAIYRYGWSTELLGLQQWWEEPGYSSWTGVMLLCLCPLLLPIFLCVNEIWSLINMLNIFPVKKSCTIFSNIECPALESSQFIGDMDNDAYVLISMEQSASCRIKLSYHWIVQYLTNWVVVKPYSSRGAELPRNCLVVETLLKSTRV